MDTFMTNWRPSSMIPVWLHSRLRTYSWVMIAIIASFALLISYVNWDSREKEARQVSQRVLTRTVSEVEYYYR
ncbi:sensor histidine kinase, partial [Streptococcus pseudopneumoniae]|nr:sensor histidine kinase [Streptococcus pseudopneumoniae]